MTASHSLYVALGRALGGIGRAGAMSAIEWSPSFIYVISSVVLSISTLWAGMALTKVIIT